MSRVVSLSLAARTGGGGDDGGAALFHWVAELRGGAGTIFEGTCEHMRRVWLCLLQGEIHNTRGFPA